MSALFQQNSVSMPQTHTFDPSLEIRRDPLVAETYLTTSSGVEDSNYYQNNVAEQTGIMLAGALGGLEGNWMYTALLQTSLQGPEPAWSRGGWSFVPIDLSNLTWKATEGMEAGPDYPVIEVSPQTANLTVQTAALRGRIECNIIKGFEPGMWLATSNGTKNSTSFDHVYYPQISMEFSNSTTYITPMEATPECCFNNTSSGNTSQSLDMDVTLGYWTENRDSNKATIRNFTTKWIHGKAGFKDVGSVPIYEPRMAFAQPPAIQVLNCVPHFETANAEVTVEPRTGNVQDFAILGDPTEDTVAWSDNIQLRRSNETYIFHNSTEERRFYHNITARLGHCTGLAT